MAAKDTAKSSKSIGNKSEIKSSKSHKTSTTNFGSFSSSSEIFDSGRYISLNLTMRGYPNEAGEFMLMVIFDKKVMLSGKWEEDTELGTDSLPIDLNSLDMRNIIVSNPIIFLLRSFVAKGKPDTDPLIHADNKAGGTIDLLPLLIGQEEIFTTLPIVSKITGEYYGCEIEVFASSPGQTEHNCIPLLLTMISANCIPFTKDGTVFISAIGLNGLFGDVLVPLEFGLSLSNSDARNSVWASTSQAGYASNTAYTVTCEDKFVPEDLELSLSADCLSYHWNAVNRILVDPTTLTERLAEPFLIDVAGVPVGGKVEVRARYLGWADAQALLVPGQTTVTVCVQLFLFSEAGTNKLGPLLNIPPTTAKTSSVRDSDIVIDESGHPTYLIIRFDLTEPLIPKENIMSLYDIIGFPPPEDPTNSVCVFATNAKPEEVFVDARYIKKAGSALSVHEELSNLACRGTVPMNQSIKRSAANLLLMRVRTMLKNFPPGNCSYIDWQDLVTGQHAASRRAVTASFAPQVPPLRLPAVIAVSRCRIAGDNGLAKKHITTALKVDGRHPRSLLTKVLRCLEDRNDLDAKNYLFDALSYQVKNKYLLWILGAQEYNKGNDGIELASAAFKIATNGDYSDGTSMAIAWAALHTFEHHIGNVYNAHVAAKNMRKAFSLGSEWKQFLKSWRESSGEEEVFWLPEDVYPDHPILIAAAFFLCLRCYTFCESLLNCVINNCASRGCAAKKYKGPYVHYLRAASLILRRQSNCAKDIIKEATKMYGPSGLLSQMRLACLANTQNYWDDDCEAAYLESERAGATPLPAMLYKGALAKYKTEPQLALQRAARCHELAPSGHSALLIGKIFLTIGNDCLAQRWCAAAVKIEPLLPDAWAILSLLAMQYEKNLDKARIMLRTARQVGPISVDIDEDVVRCMEIVEIDKLPDSLVKSMFCNKS